MSKKDFDLDMYTLTLDYDQLTKALEYGVRYTLQSLHEILRDWSNPSSWPGIVSANYMLEISQALALLTRALYYMHQGKDRKKIVVIR